MQLPKLCCSLTNMSIDADPTLGLLTVPEVADLLKISVPTLRRLQRHRQIPFIKVGGSVRFSKRDVASYLRQRRVQPID
jgi:excisionase family DNA binding protein